MLGESLGDARGVSNVQQCSSEVLRGLRVVPRASSRFPGLPFWILMRSEELMSGVPGGSLGAS